MNTNDLPESLLEAVAFFADEERAHNFFVAMRWPDGVQCAHCNSLAVGKLVVTRTKKGTARRLWNCASCGKQFTAKVGTIFAESPLPLSKWLPALWLVVNAKNGISSCELARALKITQKSAWFMGHRIRTAIQRGGGIVRADGVFEVDESYIGGLARNMHVEAKKKRENFGTGGKGKTVVQGILHHPKVGHSKVVAEVIEKTNRETLQGNVRKYVLKGSEVHTDAHLGYIGLSADFKHKVVDHAEAYVQDGVHTNGLENFWSLLKRTIKGTYVHCAPFHLYRYLDEQTYRFNERRDEKGDQGRFLNAVGTAAGRRLTWKKLTGEAKR